MSSPAPATRPRVAHIAQDAVDRARLTVVPRIRTRAPKVPFVALVSVVMLAGLVGLLMFNTNLQQASFAASSLENQANVLEAREQTLERELEALRNPQRVAAQAQQLGMVIPSAPTFLSLADGTISGPAAPALPEETLTLEGRPAVKPAELEPERTVVKVEAPPAPVQPPADGAAVAPEAPAPDTAAP